MNIYLINAHGLVMRTGKMAGQATFRSQWTGLDPLVLTGFPQHLAQEALVCFRVPHTHISVVLYESPGLSRVSALLPFVSSLTPV